jgi:hypothetical protein
MLPVVVKKHEQRNKQDAAADSEQTTRDSYDTSRAKNCHWVRARIRHERLPRLLVGSSVATEALLQT